MNADDTLIQVRDPAGISTPFSTGLLATSILATGLETPRAFGIAAEVRRRLLQEDRRALAVATLASMTEEAIASLAGAELAQRYVEWRKVKRQGRAIVVCLSGSVGIGKASLAMQLALRLGIHRVVPTDAIRETMCTVIPSTVLPELHATSLESISNGGSATSPVFGRQASAVCGAVASIARECIRQGRGVLFQGLHLVPGEITRMLGESDPDAIVVERLLTLEDEEQHRAHLARRARSEPGRPGTSYADHLDAIRAQQEQLRQLARDARVPEQDVRSEEDVTRSVVHEIVTRVTDAAARDAERVAVVAGATS